jgi:hypothetical protein
MFPSERFLARISKFRKSSRTEPVEQQVAAIRESFMELNQHLPTGIVDELFECFAAGLVDGPEDSAFDRCGKLGDMMDVLHEQYDSENDPLATQDWAAIGSVISDNAFDLDMNLVTYVMKLAVDHKAI